MALQIEAEKLKHPDALVLTHPECEESVIKLSDFVGSTAEIIDFAKNSNSKEFIICTEVGVYYKLKNDNPEKQFYFPRPCPTCKDMKLNTLESLLSVLEKEDKEVIIDEEVRRRALLPLDRMLELAK